jgi:rhodanese-related sulfurtransferase
MNIRYISAEDAYQAAKNGAVLLDVREEIETMDKWLDMENVVSIPFNDWVNSEKKPPKDKPIIVCCSVGIVSKKAATALLKDGYTDISVLENGLIAWKLANLPLKSIEDTPFQCQCQCLKNSENDA